MKRKIVLLTIAFIMAVSAGCGKKDADESLNPVTEEPVEQYNQGQSIEEQPAGEQPAEKDSPEHLTEEQQSEKAEQEQPAAQQEENTNTAAEFSFSDVSGWMFSFSSGAGAWSTELTINSDGSFEGLYNDSDMGDSGEGYPGGTRYICIFKGKFDGLERVNDFTYKFKRVSLTFEHEPGEEELADDVRYIYMTPYGLDDGEEFYLYLPGAKLKELPEEYRRWVGYYNLEEITETELTFYGLYNIKEEYGFSSYQYQKQPQDQSQNQSQNQTNGLSERIAKEIAYAEEQDAELEIKLQEDSTQSDMNETGAALHKVWDDALNTIWKMLESELDPAKLETLRTEEREWIASKDEQVKAAGLEYEGGSMQPLIQDMKAAELTRERVYELAEYAK